MAAETIGVFRSPNGQLGGSRRRRIDIEQIAHQPGDFVARDDHVAHDLAKTRLARYPNCGGTETIGRRLPMIRPSSLTSPR